MQQPWQSLPELNEPSRRHHCHARLAPVQYHYDKTVYRQRNIIERMFCRLKDWRRIATRFDRNIKNFIAAIALAAAVIWWL